MILAAHLFGRAEGGEAERADGGHQAAFRIGWPKMPAFRLFL
jgi:hypothetical protein